MANPQKENGYTAIANEIMEALAKIRIPGEARQMLDIIIRKTYGFHKKTDEISTVQFMELTGLSRGVIHRARKRLLYTKLITVYKNDNTPYLTYSFQKDYSKWIPVYKNAQYTKMRQGVSNNETGCIQKSAQSVSIIEPHKRYKDNITKDTIQKIGDFPFLGIEAFKKAFDDFLTMRVEKKKPATIRARELILKKLHVFSLEVAVAMLEQSTVNSWTDVYELKEKNNGRANQPGEPNKYAGITREIKT